jgi:hypothetical protein
MRYSVIRIAVLKGLTISHRRCGFIHGSVSVRALPSSESRPITLLKWQKKKKIAPKVPKAFPLISELHFQQIWYNFAQMNGQELPLPR